MNPIPRFYFGKNLKVVGFALSLALVQASANADETCVSCDRKILVTGDFRHFEVPDAIKIQGARPGDSEAFRKEIFGQKFFLSVPNLNPARYTVVIGLAENYFDHAGGRTFDITCGDQIIAANLDIFAKTGGAGRVLYLTNQIEFPGDATAQGPLTLAFTAHANEAKLNTFELRDAVGNSLISMRAADLIYVIHAGDDAAMQVPVVDGPEIWKDPSQPFAVRAHDLVRRLSLAEKVSQMRSSAPAIPRLDVPAYGYGNECLHGVGFAGTATVFPQAIAMAATWDTALMHQEADTIATEARAKHNDYIAQHHGDSAGHFGLNFWTPNINIFRDPRWGRGQETYGEDPFLTSRCAVAFITGLQGDDPKYLKAMACAKHYAVHSGPELERHRFNAEPSERDLYETYLPHFEAAVREGHVGSVMGAYSSLYGVPACASHLLLDELLRKQWGFDGHVVSDCGAIRDIYANHKYVTTPEEAAAIAVKAGDDLCCGEEYDFLPRAVKKGLVSEAEIDTAVGRTLMARFRLGIFDPPQLVPYSKYTIADNDTPEHESLALKVARESLVLLKNDGVLPLDRDKIRRVAVIGANANFVDVLLGNYHGTPARPVTILGGIKKNAGTNIEVISELGCPVALRKTGDKPDMVQWSKGIAAARQADVVIYVGGINEMFEGEEKHVDFEGFAGGDRTKIELPPVQTDYLKALKATGKPVVFVNCSGSAMAMPWEAKNIPAIIQAWYPGEQGGRAVADVLFGDANPAGRLPVTFYNSTADLPDFHDYSMNNRTYRYFSGQPLFAFGHGLSYTKFNYSGAKLDATTQKTGGTVKLTLSLQNSGERDGDEVVQVYFRHKNSAVPQPKLALCGFSRIHLARGETTGVAIEIPVERFRYWDIKTHQYTIESGDYELLVGAASDDIRLHLPLKIADR